MILFLSDVAGSEVLLILVFILIFFGSKSIPGIAKTFGRTIRQIKDASQDLQDEIKKSTGDMKGDLNLEGIFQEKVQEIQQPFEEFTSDLNESIKYENNSNTSNYFLNKQLEAEKQQTSTGSVSDNSIASESDNQTSSKEDDLDKIPLDQRHLTD
ncbi:MAG: twin-arginine translocase TatA/TatE family subunit [Bacteroidota bacterium]